MVGRLVEEQDVGLRRQHPGQRRPPALAAGELAGRLVAGKPEGFEENPGAMGFVARRQSRLDKGKRRLETGEIGLLRQVANGGRGLDEAAAGVGLDHAGGDLEQRRLAGAIAADETEALARADRKLDALEQRLAADAEPDVLKEEERRRHQACRQVRRNRRPMPVRFAIYESTASPW